MEETYDKIRPKDISRIMQTFTADFDGTTTVSIYCDWQQDCPKLLRATKEQILVATMIRTSLGHFQRLPYMSKACKDWEEFEQEISRNTSTKSSLPMRINKRRSRKWELPTVPLKKKKSKTYLINPTILLQLSLLNATTSLKPFP